jgi:hypothetical protein
MTPWATPILTNGSGSLSPLPQELGALPQEHGVLPQELEALPQESRLPQPGELANVSPEEMLRLESIVSFAGRQHEDTNTNE